jgi:hypothetical protein
MIFTLLSLFAISSSASASSYCVPATRVNQNVEFCEDNWNFIDQGEDCLEKLENEIEKRVPKMRSQFSKDATQQQDVKFQSSATDYSVTSKTLAALIANTDAAIEDVKEYVDFLGLPEDYDEPEVNGGDQLRYSMSVECYGDSRASLESLIADLAEVKKELQAAKKATDELQAKSKTHESNIQGSTTNSAIDENSKKAAPVLEKKKPVPGSDISGVEEMNKRKAAPKK